MTDFKPFLVDSCFMVISLAILRFLLARYKSSSEPPRPPGPKRVPILGNLLQMPQNRLWEKAVEWGREYGACQLIVRFHGNNVCFQAI